VVDFMRDRRPLFYVLASAALFGLSVPLSKLLLEDISPIALAGLLYLGSFLGLSALEFLGVFREKVNVNKSNGREYPLLALIVLLGGVLAPIFLMVGLSHISGFSASLLLNLEGVATALIASAIFREFTGKRFWLALLCMTSAGVLISWNTSAASFSLLGPGYIILAMVFWGLDNNLTRKVTSFGSLDVARIKCLFAGLINLGIGFSFGLKLEGVIPLAYAIILGTFSYGVSLVFFIRALRGWGSARTGAFFSVAPFIGALASIVILNESLGWNLLPAFVLMALGTGLIISERHVHAHHHGGLEHVHEHYHDAEHQHSHA
jgi:drug/metabolite transporter (DMT)-like permease